MTIYCELWENSADLQKYHPENNLRIIFNPNRLDEVMIRVFHRKYSDKYNIEEIDSEGIIGSSDSGTIRVYWWHNNGDEGVSVYSYRKLEAFL